VHDYGLGVAYRFAAKSLYTGSEVQIFTLYSLRILLADKMLKTLEITLICTPIIRVEAGYTEWLKQGFEFFENIILTLSKGKSQYSAGFVVYGKPQPALIFLVLDETPHFIKLHFRYFVPCDNFNGYAAYVQAIDVVVVYVAYGICRFFKVSITLSVEIRNTREISLIPEALAVISIIFSSIPGFEPS